MPWSVEVFQQRLKLRPGTWNVTGWVTRSDLQLILSGWLLIQWKILLTGMRDERDKWPEERRRREEKRRREEEKKRAEGKYKKTTADESIAWRARREQVNFWWELEGRPALLAKSCLLQLVSHTATMSDASKTTDVFFLLLVCFLYVSKWFNLHITDSQAIHLSATTTAGGLTGTYNTSHSARKNST